MGGRMIGLSASLAGRLRFALRGLAAALPRR